MKKCRGATSVLLLVLVACSGGRSGPEARGALPGTTLALSKRIVLPTAHFGTFGLSSGYVRLASSASSIEVGLFGGSYPARDAPGPAFIRFPGDTVPPECVHRAVLEFAVDVVPAGESVAVYPAKPLIMGIPEGGKLPWEYLMDTRPRGVVMFEGLRGRADITDLYRAYLVEGYFPAGHGFADAEHPDLILSVQPQSATQPESFRLVTADGSDKLGPLLELSFRSPVNGICGNALN